MDKPSVISQVKNLGTLQAISAEPRFTGIVQNVYPLTGQIGNVRKTKKTLGQGSFGRVNLEEVNSGEVATKYFTSVDNVQENVQELVTLQYLQGQPNVAQLIRVDIQPPGLLVNAVASSLLDPLIFPAAVMGKAKSTLNDQTLYTSWDDVYDTILQVLRGFSTLHSQGIAHRDIKAANILMTSAKEAWVSDFGASKYFEKGYPVTKDGYTGTYYTAAPELLMKRFLRKEEPNDFFASDAWAIGVTIYEILTDSYIFGTSVDYTEIVHWIFQRKGNPTAADGELFPIFQEYQHRVYVIPSPPKTNEIKNRIMARTIHKPADMSKLERVANVIEKLLTYNPKTRMTPHAALEELMAENVPVLPRRSIIDQYITTTPLPTNVSNEAFNTILNVQQKAIYKLLDTVAKSKDARMVILDRAAIYFMSFITTYRDHPYVENLAVISATSVFLAISLFETSNGQVKINFRIISYIVKVLYGVNNVKLPKLQECLNKFMTSGIVFVGHTFLDDLLQSKDVLTNEEYETYGLLNYICHQELVFPKYVGHLDVLKQRILDYAADATKIPLSSYISNSYEISVGAGRPKLVTDFLTYITQPIAGGSRRKYRKTYRKKARKGTRRHRNRRN